MEIIECKLKKYMIRAKRQHLPMMNILTTTPHEPPVFWHLQSNPMKRPWHSFFFWRCWYLWWPTVVSFVYVEDGSLWPSMYPLIYLTYIIIPLMPTMQWQSRNNHLFSGALVLSHRSFYLFFERKMTPWNMWMNLHYCLLFETWTQCCQLW